MNVNDKVINYANLSRFYDDLKNIDLDAKQDTLTTGQNITIDSANTISADGYVWNDTYGSLATIYRNPDNVGQIGTNVASSYGAHAEGIETTASNEGSHAEGAWGTTASGMYSHAEGGATTATGSGSHAEGQQTTASGKFSHAEGNQTIASGQGAHAEGGKLKGFNATTASGNGSHAEGQSTLATGKQSHAEGEITQALADAAHAEGQRTVASGLGSHAEGCWYNTSYPDDLTTASGRGSHAEGAATKATGDSAHAEGVKTTAQNEAEHAEGRFNISHNVNNTYGDSGNTQHSVGIGTDNNTKKNAVEVMQNGDMYLYGVGNYDGVHIKGEVSGSTVQTLQEYIASLEARIAALENHNT